MRIRGPVNKRLVSGDRMAALARGDIDELMRINRAEFGGAVMMADSDDDDDDDDQDDDADADDGADDDDNPDKGGDDDSAVELERMRKRMKAADRARAEAEKKAKRLEDEKKDDLTKATDEVTELKGQIGTLQTEVSGLRLQNAFLTSNTQTWHDPDTALALAQSKKYLEDVVDEESGEVDRPVLKKALDRLAKEHPYLVKSEETKKKDDPGDPSGEPAGGRSDNNQDDKAKKAKMKSRFPVLNR